MRLSRTIIILALALAGEGAFAQTNRNNVPGPADYTAFSRFVTDRNIFDPSRQPHFTSTRTRTRTTRSRPSSAPAFTLFGTMAYEKGLFAFFSGNSDELKQALPASGKIAGYTVLDISRSRVVLESEDKKQKLELKIGDVMRQENGKWELSGEGEVTTESTGTTESSGTTTESSPDSGSSTPASASESNDILKKLMEKREKENQ